MKGDRPQWWVETQIEGEPRPVRQGPYESEERGRAAFQRETFETRGYVGLPSWGNVIEIRLVEEFEAAPGELYGRKRLRDLVVRFCAECTGRGRSTCAEASEEIARRTSSLN